MRIKILKDSNNVLQILTKNFNYLCLSSEKQHQILIIILTRHLKCDTLRLQVMKTIGIFRRDSLPRQRGSEPHIRVYRSHAARAISEERWDVAEIFLDRILTVDPRHTEAWLMKGHLSQHCREDEQTAVDCYRKVLNLCGKESKHPHAERARTSLGRLLAIWG